jgi:hypothetical protein
MKYPAFYNCLQLLIEELKYVLKMARAVDAFCLAESIFPDLEKRWTNEVMTIAADLAIKMIAELLRLRKEAHSEQMKQLGDTCFQFSLHDGDSTDNKHNSHACMWCTSASLLGPTTVSN